jgi:TolA-binding protein
MIRLDHRLALLSLVAMALATAPCRAASGDESKPSLSVARAALEDGLYDLAQRQLQSFLATAVKGSAAADEATVLLAQALHGEERYREMRDVIGANAGQSRTAWAGALVFWHAMARYEMGEWSAALAELQDFSARYSGSPYVPRAQRLRAWCNLKAGNKADALAAFALFDKAYGAADEGAANLLDWGKALIMTEDWPGATNVLGRLIARTPENDTIHEGKYWLAQALIKAGRWEQAWNLLTLIANADNVRADRRAQAWYALSELNAAQTNMEAAVAAAAKSLELAPTENLKNRCKALQGRLLLKMGHLDEGTAVLKSVIAAAPAEPLAGALQLELARTFLEQQLYDKAADEYQFYLETFTNQTGQAQALVGRGWALWHRARYAEAATVFEKACGAATDAVEKEQCLFKSGDALFASGQYKLASETYARVLREFPATTLTPQVTFQLAESLSRLREWARAEDQFRELVRRYADSPFAEKGLVRIAEMKEEQGPARMQDALAAYAEVMAVYTNGALYAEALHRHGLVAYQLFRFEEALKDFTRVANEFDASRVAPQAYYMRGWCLYQMGREEEAVGVCRSFVERYPNTEWTPVVVFWLGEYAYNHAAYDEAEKQFVALVEMYPKDALADDALARAGQAANKQKEYLRAVDLFARLAKNYPDSPKMAEGRFFQGDALSELGEFSRAILIFEEIISKYQDSYLVSAAWGRRGDCQFTLGADDPKRYEEAMASYRTVLGDSKAGLELRLQAEYKIGRCLEKLGRKAEALEQYYNKVIYRYLEESLKTGAQNSAAAVWFTKAVFAAADILEAQKEWRQAVKILERVTEAGVSASRDAQARIDRIRKEHWILY